MTFQQEEELFPTIGADDTPAKENTNTSVVLAETDTDKTNDANRKRKGPEKSVEKKVILL